jgi:hypothetical protein
MKCCVNNCNNETYAQGVRKTKEIELSSKYCRKHFRWVKERGDVIPGKKAKLPLAERFWRKVDKKSDNECWLWTGAKNKKGYGSIGAGGRNGKYTLAHRVSYQLANNDLHDYDYVLHSCDNPSCVNPLHLRAGTQSSNIKEACDKGRKIPPTFFGEDNPKSKLTIEKVKFIRANPQLGHKEIANMFGLSPNCIRGVRIGRTWKDIK